MKDRHVPVGKLMACIHLSCLHISLTPKVIKLAEAHWMETTSLTHTQNVCIMILVHKLKAL
jgi:hypothetical protein